MKKQIALLPLLMLLVACGGQTSESGKTSTDLPASDQNTASDNNSESSGTSEEPILPTDALTDSMMTDIKLGYKADYRFQISYDDGGSGSSYHYLTSVGTDGFFYEAYYLKDGNEKRTEYVHIESKENDPYAYDASLGLDNTVWYKNITATDNITNEEYDVEWADAGYSNLFAGLSASDFTKEDDNTFALSSTKAEEISVELANQLFSPDDLYTPHTDPKSFKLKTSGEKIVGYELEFLPYTSYGSVAYYKASGKFTATGASSFEKLKPVEGETKPELDAILNTLKGENGKQNYEIHQTQSQYDFDRKTMVPMGEMDIKVQDGEKAQWIYRNTSGKKTSDYGYYAQKSDNGEDCKRGVIQIGDNYYNDIYLYQGSMKDYLPSFNFSSVFFDKDTEASKDGKIVYKLNKSYDISLDNNSTFFTPEEMDAYRDRLIYVTITQDGDTITIRNSTGDGGLEESGLILNCEYTNIGKVTGLFAEDHMKENVDDLKWTDLLSRNEETRDSIVANYTAEVLDAIPTLGGTWSNVYSDISSGATKPIFYVITYEEETNTELMDDMGKKLVNAGFASYTPDSSSDSDTSTYYRKNVDITSKGKTKTYSLNISLTPWWNKYSEYGQFQMSLSLSAAVK